MNESATKPSDLGVTIPFQAFVAIRFENIPHLVGPQGCPPFRHYTVYYQIFGYLNVLGCSFYKNLALVIRPSFIAVALWAPGIHFQVVRDQGSAFRLRYPLRSDLADCWREERCLVQRDSSSSCNVISAVRSSAPFHCPWEEGETKSWNAYDFGSHRGHLGNDVRTLFCLLSPALGDLLWFSRAC